MTNSKSKIVATRSDEETKENSAKRLFRNNRDEDRGGMLMIRGLWARSTDCIVDVRVTDFNARSVAVVGDVRRPSRQGLVARDTQDGSG